MDKELFRRTWKNKIKEQRVATHLKTTEIFGLLIRDNSSKRNDILTHLALCPWCLEKFHKILEAEKKTEFLDIALPQLAGAKNVCGFMKIDTEGRKYTIIIQPSLKEQDKGMITVEVAQNLREKSEGTTIMLKDRKGRKLIEGTIVNGQVSQKIDDLDNIDIQRFNIERR